ncbi:MAG: glycosyl transferase [Crenarchaeota archaeon]|nr:glycosyl transferase [Thermoproteota archaeon]
MSKLKRGIKLLKKDPKRLFSTLGRNEFLNWIPDKPYLKIAYYYETGKKLDLNNPVTFNEKLQWLKLYDRKPQYTIFADKYAVRDYIKQRIGGKYLIPLIGVYDTVDEIPWDELPNKFVLKCTHGSKSNIICTDKNRLDIKRSKTQLSQWMKKNWFWFGREWPYKNLRPRIICEEFMEDASGGQLKDYKFYCFHGEPKVIQVISERNNGHYYIDHYDLEWNKFIIPRKNYSKDPVAQDKPKDLDEMISISRELSKNIPFARIDLYNTESGISFGEITFFPVSGFIDFSDQQTDYLLGSWLRLPQYKI